MWYDLGDMISEVTECVIIRSRHYKPERGKESTFVFRVANNKCKTILGHFCYRKRAACETVELTDDIARILEVTEIEKQSEAFRISLEAVERVIQFSSDSALDLLERIFTGRIRYNQLISEEAMDQIRETAQGQSASLDDFLRVLKYCQA